ncbi:MAG: translocation/assembly module TamB domain-containing protein [Pseudomonadota bacterium]
MRPAEEGGSLLRLDRFDYAGATATGRLTIGEDGLIRGPLSFSAPDLSTLSALAGAPLAGAATAKARFGPAGRGAGAAQGLRAEARLDRFSAAALGIDQAILTASGALSALETTISANGLRAAGVSDGALEAAARIRLDPGDGDDAAVDLRRLTFDARDAAIALAEPTRLRLRGGGVRLEETRLTVNDGAVTLRGAAGRRLEAEIAFEETPLDVLGALGLAPISAGRVNGAAALSSRAPARLDADLRASGVDLGASGLRVAAETGFDAALTASWRGGPLSLAAEIAPPGAAPLTLEARAPLTPGPVPTLSPAAPIEGRLAWEGEAARLWALAPTEAALLEGPLTLDLGLGGTVAAPALEGFAALSGGRLQIVATGTDLRALDARIEASPEGAARLRLTARDAEGPEAGGLALTAESDLGGGGAVFDATFDRAALLRREDASARVDGRLSGAIGGAAPGIVGALEIGPAEFRLIGGGVTAPPLIETRDRRGPPPERAPRPGRDAVSATPLDIKVAMPRRIFARGRGLDSEWEGDLAVSGVLGAPRIVGTVTARRGAFSFAGSPFAIRGSEILFTGPPIPELAIRLTRDTGEIEGAIEVTGPATQPEIGFSATPELPEDEVLPQLIFGRSLSQLTSLEAAQLASGLAALTSGKPGALEAARDLVGVDKLSVGAGDSGQTRVSAGTYVAPGVFVEAQEGVDPADRAVRVEIEVAPQIRLDGEAGAAGDVGVGLEWRRDY